MVLLGIAAAASLLISLVNRRTSEPIRASKCRSVGSSISASVSFISFLAHSASWRSSSRANSTEVVLSRRNLPIFRTPLSSSATKMTTECGDGFSRYADRTDSSVSVIVSRKPDAEIRISVMRITRRDAIIGNCSAAARARSRLSSVFRLKLASLKSRKSPSSKARSATVFAAISRRCVSGPKST